MLFAQSHPSEGTVCVLGKSLFNDHTYAMFHRRAREREIERRNWNGREKDWLWFCVAMLSILCFTNDKYLHCTAVNEEYKEIVFCMTEWMDTSERKIKEVHESMPFHWNTLISDFVYMYFLYFVFLFTVYRSLFMLFIHRSRYIHLVNWFSLHSFVSPSVFAVLVHC